MSKRRSEPRPRPTPPAASVQGESCVTSCHSEPLTVTATERSLSPDSPNPGEHPPCARPLERGPAGPSPHVETSGACCCHPTAAGRETDLCPLLTPARSQAEEEGPASPGPGSGDPAGRAAAPGRVVSSPAVSRVRDRRPLSQAGRGPWAGAGGVSWPRFKHESVRCLAAKSRPSWVNETGTEV